MLYTGGEQLSFLFLFGIEDIRYKRFKPIRLTSTLNDLLFFVWHINQDLSLCHLYLKVQSIPKISKYSIYLILKTSLHTLVRMYFKRAAVISMLNVETQIFNIDHLILKTSSRKDVFQEDCSYFNVECWDSPAISAFEDVTKEGCSCFYNFFRVWYMNCSQKLFHQFVFILRPS